MALAIFNWLAKIHEVLIQQTFIDYSDFDKLILGSTTGSQQINVKDSLLSLHI